jgi:hypothetical protein
LSGDDGTPEENPVYTEYAWHSFSTSESGCSWTWYNAESDTYFVLFYDPDADPRWSAAGCENFTINCVDGVLTGTGGKLTMLSDPTGLGQGASGAQAAVFAEKFPSQPVLAYFELAAPDKEDIGAIVSHAVQLSQAGYMLDAEELSERTGYKLEVRSQKSGCSVGCPSRAVAESLVGQGQGPVQRGPARSSVLRQPTHRRDSRRGD